MGNVASKGNSSRVVGNNFVGTAWLDASGTTRKIPIAGLEETYVWAITHAAERAIMTGANGIIAERMADLRPMTCPVISSFEMRPEST